MILYEGGDSFYVLYSVGGVHLYSTPKNTE